MRLERGALISDLDPELARDVARLVQWQPVPVSYVAGRLERPEADVLAWLERLETDGFLERSQGRGWDQAAQTVVPQDEWTTTVRGGALAGASFLKPITRAKAQALLDGALERVRAYNDDPEKPLWIDEVTVFGSYLDPEASQLVLLDQIRVKTQGDWQGVAPAAIEEFGDYIAGAYEGKVVSVYKITDHAYDAMPVSHRRVTFEVEAAPEIGGLIGQPCPGGAWKRGEARPVRYIATTEVMHFMDHELDLAEPGLADAVAVDAAIVAHLHMIGQPRTVTDALTGGLLDQVEVELNPRGGIVVTVPSNTRVLFVPRAG